MPSLTNKVVLFGNGQTAAVAHAFLSHESRYEVVAFAVDGAHVSAATYLGLPLVAFEDVQHRFPPDAFAMYVSISFRRVNQLRAEKYREAKGKGYRLISHVSPRAVTMPDLQIGDNCWIGPNTVVEPWVTIGDDVFIGGSSHVSHHCVIKDHCFIAASVAIAGFVTVEPYCFIGLNATVRDGITLARSTVVGGGALLLKDTAEASVYMARSSTPIPIRSDDLAEDFRHPAPAHP